MTCVPRNLLPKANFGETFHLDKTVVRTGVLGILVLDWSENGEWRRTHRQADGNSSFSSFYLSLLMRNQPSWRKLPVSFRGRISCLQLLIFTSGLVVTDFAQQLWKRIQTNSQCYVQYCTEIQCNLASSMAFYTNFGNGFFHTVFTRWFISDWTSTLWRLTFFHSKLYLVSNAHTSTTTSPRVSQQ